MLVLSLGDPTLAASYDSRSLSAADQRRADAPRSARAELDWRVSRVLAARLRLRAGVGRDAPVALSHSRGHALAGLAPADWRLAVDLERCRARDVAALAQWVCDAGERAMLASASEAARLEAFYVLWTVKEALLKALDLPFPAGMRQVGLTLRADGSEALRVSIGRWRAQVWRLPGQWIASAAWNALADGAPRTLSGCWAESDAAEVLGCWDSA